MKIINIASKQVLIAWTVWSIAVLYYLYEYILRISPSVMVNELMQDFDINALDLGNLSATYFYVYAVCQIPVGIIADRFGPKRPLLCACLICTLGCWLFSESNSLVLAEVSRALIGLGSAFGYICCMRLVINWFPKKRFALMCALVNMTGLIGAFFGEVILSHFMTFISWRSLLGYLIFFGVINAVLILIWVKDYPFVSKKQQPREPLIHLPIRKSLLKILSSPQIWILGIYAGTIYCTFDTLAALWGGEYLRSVYHLNKIQAAEINSLIFLGAVFGFPFFGALASLLKRRHQLLMILSATCILIDSIVILLEPQNLALVSGLFFMLGFFSGTLCIAITLGKERMPVAISALTVSVLNTALVIIGALSQPLFGFILKMGSNIKPYTLSSLTSNDFHRAFLLIVCLYSITLVCALMTKQKIIPITK